MEIKDNRLGPVLKVISYTLDNTNLYLIVNPNTSKGNIISDAINQMVSNAFIFIVKEFLRNNEIHFIPDGDFDSWVTENEPKLEQDNNWHFRIYGKILDPMEVFINNLNS